MTWPLAKLLLVDLLGAARAAVDCGGKPCDHCLAELRAAVVAIEERMTEESNI